MLNFHVTYISRFDRANIQFMRIRNTIWTTYTSLNTCTEKLNIYQIFIFLLKQS